MKSLSPTQASVLGLLDRPGGIYTLIVPDKWNRPGRPCYVTNSIQREVEQPVRRTTLEAMERNRWLERFYKGVTYAEYTISEAGRAAYREWREAQNEQS